MEKNDELKRLRRRENQLKKVRWK